MSTTDRIRLSNGKDVETFTVDLWRPPYPVLADTDGLDTQVASMAVDGPLLVVGLGFRFVAHPVQAEVVRYKKANGEHQAGQVKSVLVMQVTGPLLRGFLSEREREHIMAALRRGIAALLAADKSRVHLPREALDGA